MKKLIEFLGDNWEILAMVIVTIALIVCLVFAIDAYFYLGNNFKEIAK